MSTQASISGDEKLTPYLTNIDPDILLPTDTNVELEIDGDNFDNNTVFAFNGGGITVNSVTLDNTQRVLLDVTANGINGVFKLEVTNGGNPDTIGTHFVFILSNILEPDNDVPWENINGDVNLNNGEIEGGDGAGFDKSATFGSIPANTDGILEGKMDGDANDHEGFFGLNSGPLNSTNPFDIDYAFSFGPNKLLQIYELGVLKWTAPFDGAKKTFKIIRSSGQITYEWDNEVVYVSATPSTAELHFHTCIFRKLHIKDLEIAF